VQQLLDAIANDPISLSFSPIMNRTQSIQLFFQPLQITLPALLTLGEFLID
jgi:hypothetical protein